MGYIFSWLELKSKAQRSRCSVSSYLLFATDLQTGNNRGEERWGGIERGREVERWSSRELGGGGGSVRCLLYLHITGTL